MMTVHSAAGTVAGLQRWQPPRPAASNNRPIAMRSAYQTERRPDLHEEPLPQTVAAMPATHVQAWREQEEAVVALVNSRRGHRRAVKLRKKLLHDRQQAFDLLEYGDYSNPDNFGGAKDADSGSNDDTSGSDGLEEDGEAQEVEEE
eukprot:SAG22_NODE_2264_length_2772_cov_1.847737_2_plen_145_part_01